MSALPPPPAYRRQPLRIACVQFDPQIGKVPENAAKVTRMTAGLRPGQVDLLVLPEMALSGYMYEDGAEIAPYLEKRGAGPTSSLATTLAQRLNCHVVAGYPEALADGEAGLTVNGSAALAAAGGSGEANGHSTGTSESPPEPLRGVGYNSAVLAGPGGVIGNYRKTFLFETDKRWSREGDGFSHFDLPAPLGRVSIGICMDLNPKEFLAPWNAFELATYCVTNNVDVLVCPMNWLDPAEQDPEPDSDSDSTPPPPHDLNAPSESNLNYWAARLSPLHDPTPTYDATGLELPPPRREMVFVACNRAGVERGTRFAGTSCVMTLASAPSAIELIECCNRAEERVMICQV